MEDEYVGGEVDEHLRLCAEADGPAVRAYREERVREVLGGLPAVVVKGAGDGGRWTRRRWVTSS